MEREVMVGSGKKERLVSELRRMADEVEEKDQADFYCDGNGPVPALHLSFTVERGEPDWDDPLVDYSEV